MCGVAMMPQAALLAVKELLLLVLLLIVLLLVVVVVVILLLLLFVLIIAFWRFPYVGRFECPPSLHFNPKIEQMIIIKCNFC